MIKALKKFLAGIAIAMFATVALAANTAWAADFSKLRILHTNDSHGYLMHDEEHNGAAVIAQLKRDLESQGYDVILLSAGDFSQDNNLVNYSQGKSAIDIFNAAGYDAATIGNHEFDYGQDILLRNISMAKFPVVSSNIIVDATGKGLLPSTAIIRKGDLKIGIFGLTTPWTVVSSAPKNTNGLSFANGEDLYACAQKQVDDLKAAGCDLIIALGHLGEEESLIGNRSVDVLDNVTGIDIFIDGHDHVVKNKYVNGVLLAEAAAHTKTVGQIKYDDGKWVEDMIPHGKFTVQADDVKQVVDTAYTEMQAAFGKVIGESKVNLDGNRAPGVRTQETNLGDLVTDAFLWQARKADVLDGGVDIALYNGGGIRKSIETGAMKKEDLIAVLPYNNQLYVATITGEKLLEILEAATSVTPEPVGAFPQVSGIKYTLNTTVPFELGVQYERSQYFAPAKPGSRVTIESVGGKKFDSKAEYNIVATEFVMFGGDSYGGLAMEGATKDLHSIGYVDEVALENYIIEELGGVIGDEYAEPQGRINIIVE